MPIRGAEAPLAFDSKEFFPRIFCSWRHIEHEAAQRYEANPAFYPPSPLHCHWMGSVVLNARRAFQSAGSSTHFTGGLHGGHCRQHVKKSTAQS